MRILPLLALAVALAPSGAQAHDLWIDRQGSELALHYGHRGGKAMAIDAAGVRSIRCVKGKGSSDLLPAAKISPREIRFAGDCDAVAVFLDAGTWSLTPDGEKRLPRSRCPDAVKSWEAKSYAKWLDSKATAAPIGEGLEIVPVSDLAKVRAGDKASFRVLFDGKPLAGAWVAVGHKTLGETDSRGEARVLIRAADAETIDASYKRKISSPDADFQVFEASLTFEVAR